jgi:hypothetical protein
MSNFVDNNVVLPANKTDLVPIPVGSSATNYVAANDYNSLSQASQDIRTVIERQVSIMSYGADPTGATDSSAAFTAAFAALSGGGVLHLPGVSSTTGAVYKITTNVNVPSYVTLKFDNSLINITSGNTLTIAGPIVAVPQQIFESSNGTPVTIAVAKVIPQWFGAIANGSTDCTSAIQQALNSLVGGAGELFFPPGTYKISTQLTLQYKWGCRIHGSDQDTSIIQASSTFTNAVPMLQYETCRDITTEHLQFSGSSTASHIPLCAIQSYANGGASFGVPDQNRFKNCRFGQGTIVPFSDCGILFSASAGHDGNNDLNEIESCWFLACGIHLGHSQCLGNRIHDNVIDGANISNNITAILLQGGSFVSSSNIFLQCLTIFHFEEAVGDFGNVYNHSCISEGDIAEDCTQFVLADSNAGTVDGPVHFMVSNGDLAPNGISGTSIDINWVVDFEAPYGEFTLTNSDFFEGQTYSGIKVTDAHSILRLFGNRIGITNITWSPNVSISLGNTWVVGNITVTSSSPAGLLQLGDNGSIFTAGSDNPYSPLVNTQFGLIDNTVIYSNAASAYTLALTDSSVLVACNTGSPVVTLPVASTCPGKEYLIKQAESSVTSLTINSSGGTIEGGSSYTWTEPFTYAKFKAIGGNWYVILAGCYPSTLTPVNGGNAGIYGTSAINFEINGVLTAQLTATAFVLESGIGLDTGSSPGLSATITTAKLTGGGTEGSMTFTNGILTAHTDAT